MPPKKMHLIDMFVTKKELLWEAVEFTVLLFIWINQNRDNLHKLNILNYNKRMKNFNSITFSNVQMILYSLGHHEILRGHDSRLLSTTSDVYQIVRALSMVIDRLWLGNILCSF